MNTLTLEVLAAAQVHPATLHAVLSTQDWRMLLDIGLGCYAPPRSLSTKAQELEGQAAIDAARSSAGARTAKGGATLHASALALLRAYLHAPDAIQAEDQDCDVLSEARPLGRNALHRLQGLELMAAPGSVADAYADALADAAAGDGGLSVQLISCASNLLDGLQPVSQLRCGN